MKRTQWQFTHRQDNQMDIKRILREARADGLTLVEVKGGPESLRGVYLDSKFIAKHKEHWPGDTSPIATRPTSNRDGWTGNYQVYAADAKHAHEKFCRNLEAARAAEAAPKREYPPTVSVRAAGPQLTPITVKPARTEDANWLPKPGEWFTVGPRRMPAILGASWCEGRDDLLIGKTLQCVGLAYDEIHIRFEPPVNGLIRHLDLRDFAYLTPAQDPTAPAKPYIPVPGDKFTAKGIASGALTRLQTYPHGDVLTCLSAEEGGSTLRVWFPGETDDPWVLTAKYYEFKKVQS